MIITRMVINMDETRLRTIEQLEEFLKATPEVAFTAPGIGAHDQRYAHISRVLARFDYPRRNKRERAGLPQLRHRHAYRQDQLSTWTLNPSVRPRTSMASSSYPADDATILAGGMHALIDDAAAKPLQRSHRRAVGHPGAI